MRHSMSKDTAFNGVTTPRHTPLYSDSQCLPPGDPRILCAKHGYPITGKSFICPVTMHTPYEHHGRRLITTARVKKWSKHCKKNIGENSLDYFHVSRKEAALHIRNGSELNWAISKNPPFNILQVRINLF